MPRIMIGVMGPGAGATSEDLGAAYDLGQAIAQQGWVLLTGGRNSGVMAAATAGAQGAGGLTVGILPGPDDKEIAPGVDISICTDLGQGRNNVNILSATVVIAVGMGLGTASEIALALKQHKPVIFWQPTPVTAAFFGVIAPGQWHSVQTVTEAIAQIQAEIISR
ncbi:P450 cytochrome, putative [[Synechococcus] sp. NIES-970]|nr:P450 cytochrome, putative [[Synechococcus] sp. NIES-970]